jgi:hypothetical protein
MMMIAAPLAIDMSSRRPTICYFNVLTNQKSAKKTTNHLDKRERIYGHGPIDRHISSVGAYDSEFIDIGAVV